MTPSLPLVLNISQSLSNRRWVWRHPLLADPFNQTTQALMQHGGLEELPARILAGRHITPHTISEFLTPTLRKHLPNPSILKNMDETAIRLANAVQNKEKIGIFGDYDVDGACGTALLTEILQKLGCTTLTHIPDRLKEGYGPNIPALENFISQGATLLICVDCGTAAINTLNAFEGRADRIILDHHKAESGNLPLGYVVNPNQIDCHSVLGHICATAVAFMAMIALLRELRARNFFTKHNPAPDLLPLLDITALATICDVMPLRDINRLFVIQGLKIMKQKKRLGLKMLSEVAGIKDNASATSCAWALGPRINAGGRIAKAGLGLQLLLSQEEGEARALAEELDQINQQRQKIEGDILQTAYQQAEKQLAQGHATFFLYGKNWHPGVVGIIAGRIKERFNRPALVGALDDNIIKGSARSVKNLDIGNVILAAKEHNILVSGGGHAMAAGFSLKEEHAKIFHDFLDEHLSEAKNYPPQEDLLIDGLITLNGAKPHIAQQIASLAPFGTAHEEPMLVIPHIRCVKSDRIGNNKATLRVILESEDGDTRLKGLVFHADDKNFTPILEDKTHPLLHIAGQLRLETWQEQENLTFFISDAFCA